jgi:hypothetical protein
MPHSKIIPILLLLAPLAGRADVPATMPSTQPAARFAPDAPARTWFAQLASIDDAKRDEARTSLMGLTRDDLPALRKLVDESRPLAAAQVAALHEIVLQLYLSGEPYEVDASPVDLAGLPTSPGGFLGLVSGSEGYGSSRLGVPVERRIPGFASFRVLRDGDLILAIIFNPDVPLFALPNVRTSNFEIFKQAIAGVGPNRDVTLEILRQGQRIRVTTQLGARPAIANHPQEQVEEYFAQRLQKAENYWQQELLPLLKAGIS